MIYNTCIVISIASGFIDESDEGVLVAVVNKIWPENLAIWSMCNNF